MEKYGLVGIGYAFALYFGAIVQYGFGVTATRDIARNRQDRDAVSCLYATVLASSALLALCAVCIAVLIVLVFPQMRGAWPLYLLSLAHVVVQSMFPVWFFQGMERMAYITYLSLASKVAFLIGLLLMVHEPEDYLYVPLLNLGSATIVLVCSLWIARRIFKVSVRMPGWPAVRGALFCGRHAFVNQFAPNLYNNTTTFLLGLIAGGHAVGLYAASTKVIDAVSSLGYILSNTFLPYLSRSLDNHGLFKKIMLSAGLAGTFCLLIFADWIGCLLLPSDGPAIADLLRMTSASVFMIFAMLTFGTNYLMLRKKEDVAGRISLYISLIFFLVASVLVPAYGLLGSVVTLLGARICMALAFYTIYRINEVR